MKQLFVVVSLAALCSLLGYLAYRLVLPRQRNLVGNREWAKNPALPSAADNPLAVPGIREVPADISAAEIQKMVDRLFVMADEDFNLHRLKQVGEKAIPALVHALDSPQTLTAQLEQGSRAWEPQSPLERMVELLAPFGPAEAAGPLAKFVDHEIPHVREQAAFALGNIGTQECIGPVVKALEDEVEDVRSRAMFGIERGMQANRCQAEFLQGVFPALLKLANRPDSPSIDNRAPSLLLAIDPDRAASVMLSPEIFHPNNRQVGFILHAMNQAGQKIPHDLLLPFLAAV